MRLKIIRIIGFIEIGLGCSTITGLLVTLITGASSKPVNVFIFVLTTALISATLGIGILKHNNLARRMLLIFSGYILLTKIMLYVGLISFSGEMIKFIPLELKDTISFGYHLGLILILKQGSVKSVFSDRRQVKYDK